MEVLWSKTLKFAFVTVAGVATLAWTMFLVQTILSFGASLL